MQPDALLIDAMGTLVRLQNPVGRLQAQLTERFGVPIDADVVGRALRAEIAHYRAHMHQASDAATLARLRRDCARVLADALGPPLADVDPAAMTAALLAALRFAAFPDAAPALVRARLAWAGLRVVVVSNWDVGLPEALRGAGLADRLDGVVSSAGVGAAKPDPRPFRRALALAGVGADRAVHVGDSVAEDVLGARATGIAAVLLDRGPGPPASPPDGVPVIDGLEGLLAAVADLSCTP